MPRKLRAEAPSKPVRFRLSPMELRQAAIAAHINRQSVAEFIRDAIVTAAADCIEEHELRRPPPR